MSLRTFQMEQWSPRAVNVHSRYVFVFFCFLPSVICLTFQNKTGHKVARTHCEGHSSPGFHPLRRRTLSSGRSLRFYSTAFWDPWSSRGGSRCCRRPQVSWEAWWFLLWPSPRSTAASSPRRAGALLRPPTSLPANRLLPGPLLHSTNWYCLTSGVTCLEERLTRGNGCPPTPRVCLWVCREVKKKQNATTNTPRRCQISKPTSALR